MPTTPITPGAVCQVQGCDRPAANHTLCDYWICALHFHSYATDSDWLIRATLIPRPGQPHLRIKEPPYDEPWKREQR